MTDTTTRGAGPAARAERAAPRVAETTLRERIVLAPGERCPDCGGALRLVGEDVSEILDLIAAMLKVIETARLKKSCRCCEKIVQPAAPTRPVPRGMAGAGLLAHILVAKYDDHLPLYRQGEILARHSADNPRSTLTDWCGQAITALRPLSERIVERRVPASITIHIILDNYAAHKHPKVRSWLDRHPRWTFHFTPTSASWLNAVEGFFAKLTRSQAQTLLPRRPAGRHQRLHRTPQPEPQAVRLEGRSQGHHRRRQAWASNVGNNPLAPLSAAA